MGEDHDLLIRIDTKTEQLQGDIAEVKTFVRNAPCAVQAEKVNRIEKWLVGTVLALLVMSVKKMWSVFSG